MAGRLDRTEIGAPGLEVCHRFGDVFDSGDDRWHQIRVEGVEDGRPTRVMMKRGGNPGANCGRATPAARAWSQEAER
jgi:hypothetical protein